MDNPADLINATIEELVKNRYELPSFATLDRLVGHIRTRVNKKLFAQVTETINREFKQQFTVATNKVEAYHGFSKWFFFSGDRVIATNDVEQQEKIIKYNDLIANAVIFQNVVDLTDLLQQFQREGYFARIPVIPRIGRGKRSRRMERGDRDRSSENNPYAAQDYYLI